MRKYFSFDSSQQHRRIRNYPRIRTEQQQWWFKSLFCFLVYYCSSSSYTLAFGPHNTYTRCRQKDTVRHYCWQQSKSKTLGTLQNHVNVVDKRIPVLFMTNHHIEHVNSNYNNKNAIVPKHIAFVCDGNSRWAQNKCLPSVAGHEAGANRMLQLLETCKQIPGIEYCTLFGFSTENWKRPSNEIKDILALVEYMATLYCDRAINDKVHVKVVGDLQDKRIPESLRKALLKLEHDTTAAATKPKLTVCLAINYGGRRDIVHASIQLATAIATGQLDPTNVTEEHFKTLLWTHGVPDPDLIIRTGGEYRLSNFLLFEAAYAELYFTNTLWPDFDTTQLDQALSWFANRSRRFGGRDRPVVVSSLPT